jgi:hypothetical protein
MGYIAYYDLLGISRFRGSSISLIFFKLLAYLLPSSSDFKIIVSPVIDCSTLTKTLFLMDLGYVSATALLPLFRARVPFAVSLCLLAFNMTGTLTGDLTICSFLNSFLDGFIKRGDRSKIGILGEAYSFVNVA